MKKKIKHQDVLHFWFTEIAPESWFKKDVDFDAALKGRFGGAVTNALAGRLDNWADNADGCLALIILLDQFTRNIFRQSARAFSGDEMALGLSLRCVDRGYLDTAGVSHCHFMLMPMMHSEDIEIQVSSLPLFSASFWSFFYFFNGFFIVIFQISFFINSINSYTVVIIMI